MRAIILYLTACVAAVVFAGCQVMADPQPEVAHKRSMTGFATLASSGTFEEATAPVKTRAAKLAHNVSRLAAAKRLAPAVADHVRARITLAEALLADAQAADQAGNAARAKDKLRWATAAIEDGELALAKGRS